MLPVSLLLLLALIAAALPWPSGAGADQNAEWDAEWGAAPNTAAIMPVVAARCTGCHADEPGFEGFAEAPLGVVLETAEQVEAQAARIHQVTVATPTMPPGNITGMTPEERVLLDRWHGGRSR